MAKNTSSSSKSTKRSYGLSDETIAELKAIYKKSGNLAEASPHRDQCYGWIFAALVNGNAVNKWQSWETIAERVKKEATGPKWQAFQRKETRNEETGKDTSERLFQNVLVLQRPDYGMKIFDLKHVIGGGSKGVVIDLQRGKGDEIQVRLNTNATEPMKLARKAKAEPLKVEPKAVKKTK